MTDLDTLRPEVREAVNVFDTLGTNRPWRVIRAELLRLAALEQNAKLPDLMARANRLIARGAANERAEKADAELAEARAELLRLANENFGMHLALSEHDALCEQSTTYRLRAEKAEGDCNDLRKRLNDAISERNTIRRERAQEHSKHAREGAELAALKARIFQGIVLDVDDLARGHAGLPSEWRGRRVRLVVSSDD